MLRKLIGSAAAAAMILAVAPGAAHAATATVSDPTGDAGSARYDITAVTGVNTNSTVKTISKIKDVQATGRVVMTMINGDKVFGVTVTKTKSGIKKVLVNVATSSTKKCSGIDVNWSAGKNKVTIAVPQKCLANTAPASWTLGVGTFNGTTMKDINDNSLTVQKG